jgi:hypothetical protein
MWEENQIYGESARMPIFCFVIGLISSFPIIEIAKYRDEIDLFRVVNPVRACFLSSLRRTLQRNVSLPWFDTPGTLPEFCLIDEHCLRNLVNVMSKPNGLESPSCVHLDYRFFEVMINVDDKCPDRLLLLQRRQTRGIFFKGLNNTTLNIWKKSIMWEKM